jgi:hypothetical protein
MKKWNKFGSTDQMSKYDNKQIYYSADELVTEVILKKNWWKLYFNELIVNAPIKLFRQNM